MGNRSSGLLFSKALDALCGGHGGWLLEIKNYREVGRRKIKISKCVRLGEPGLEACGRFKFGTLGKSGSLTYQSMYVRLVQTLSPQVA